MNFNSSPIIMIVSFFMLSSLAIAQEGNAVLTRCAGEGTTYDKTKCKDANTGRVFSFGGVIFDVKDATTLTVRINSSNYADVTFKSNVGDSVRKDQTLNFRGRLARVGTGIMFRHEIDDAVLE